MVRQLGPGLAAIGVVLMAVLAILALSPGPSGRETALVGQDPVPSETIAEPEPTKEPRQEAEPTAEPKPTEEAPPEAGLTAEPEPEPTEVAQTPEAPTPREPGPSEPASAPPVEIDPATSPAPAATVGPADPEPAASPALHGPRAPGDAPWAQVGADGDGVHTLWVGTVAGATREAITRDVPVLISGPVNGQVLAWWDGRDTATVVLVDTADGTRSTVARPNGDLGYGASLDPSGRFVYMAPRAGDGRIEALYRMPVEGGEPERIADGWSANAAVMTWSLDGRWLAISDMNGTDTVHRVLDTRDDTLAALRDSGIGDTLGFLGDDLVGYAAEDGDGELRYPLLGLDVTTGRTRTLVDGEGLFADVLPDAEGDPLLVYDAPDGEWRYTLRTTDGSGGSKLLFTSDDEWVDATMGEGGTNALVRTNQWNGVWSPGYVPVFPGGLAYIWPGYREVKGDDRIMVDVTTTEPVTFDVVEVQS